VRGLLLLPLALLVAVALTAAPAPAGLEATPRIVKKATLRVVTDLPLRVRGTGFRPGEPVRVTVDGGDLRRVRLARAGRMGAFVVSFGTARFDWCATPPEITARGPRTGLVSLVVPPRECMMP
jgi:hypothetical protein